MMTMATVGLGVPATQLMGAVPDQAMTESLMLVRVRLVLDSSAGAGGLGVRPWELSASRLMVFEESRRIPQAKNELL